MFLLCAFYLLEIDANITLFTSMKFFCGTDNIPQNILHIFTFCLSVENVQEYVLEYPSAPQLE